MGLFGTRGSHRTGVFWGQSWDCGVLGSVIGLGIRGAVVGLGCTRGSHGTVWY